MPNPNPADQIVDYITKKKGSQADDLVSALNLSKATAYRHLNTLLKEGKLSKENDFYRLNIGSTTNKSKTTIADPPLVDLEVTNPVTYLKHWWAKVIGDEEVNLKLNLNIKPLTALGIVTIVATVGFGAGQAYVISALKQTPLGQYVVTETKRSAAFQGTLYYHQATETYYLTTTEPELIKLEPVKNVKIDRALVGQPIVVVGPWYPDEQKISVESVGVID